jgi:hypothetical protein
MLEVVWHGGGSQTYGGGLSGLLLPLFSSVPLTPAAVPLFVVAVLGTWLFLIANNPSKQAQAVVLTLFGLAALLVAAIFSLGEILNGPFRSIDPVVIPLGIFPAALPSLIKIPWLGWKGELAGARGPVFDLKTGDGERPLFPVATKGFVTLLGVVVLGTLSYDIWFQPSGSGLTLIHVVSAVGFIAGASHFVSLDTDWTQERQRDVAFIGQEESGKTYGFVGLRNAIADHDDFEVTDTSPDLQDAVNMHDGEKIDVRRKDNRFVEWIIKGNRQSEKTIKQYRLKYETHTSLNERISLETMDYAGEDLTEALKLLNDIDEQLSGGVCEAIDGSESPDEIELLRTHGALWWGPLNLLPTVTTIRQLFPIIGTESSQGDVEHKIAREIAAADKRIVLLDGERLFNATESQADSGDPSTSDDSSDNDQESIGLTDGGSDDESIFDDSQEDSASIDGDVSLENSSDASDQGGPILREALQLRDHVPDDSIILGITKADYALMELYKPDEPVDLPEDPPSDQVSMETFANEITDYLRATRNNFEQLDNNVPGGVYPMFYVTGHDEQSGSRRIVLSERFGNDDRAAGNIPQERTRGFTDLLEEISKR